MPYSIEWFISKADTSPIKNRHYEPGEGAPNTEISYGVWSYYLGPWERVLIQFGLRDRVTTPLMQGWSKPIQSCRAELTWSLMFRERYSTREIFSGITKTDWLFVKKWCRCSLGIVTDTQPPGWMSGVSSFPLAQGEWCHIFGTLCNIIEAVYLSRPLSELRARQHDYRPRQCHTATWISINIQILPGSRHECG